MLRKHLSTERFHIEDGRLHLGCGKDALSGTGNPSYIGVRVEEYDFSLGTTMEFTPKVGEEAGLVYFYNAENYLTLSVSRENKGLTRKIVKVEKGKEITLFCEECKQEAFGLRIEGKQGKMSCFLNEQCLVEQVSLDTMTTEEAGGFVGCTMGVFAVTGQGESDTQAVFESLQIAYS